MIEKWRKLILVPKLIFLTTKLKELITNKLKKNKRPN